MRLAELQVGGVYTFKHGGGRFNDWYVGELLDTAPWESHYGRLAPRSTEGVGARVRSVPIAEFVPTVRLADGTRYRVEFGPSLHVFQGGGWTRKDVRLDQLDCDVVPRLVSISLIARRVG